MELITLSPINIFFCNVNKVMKLSGHCHYATVILSYRTVGEVGFPVFKSTVGEIAGYLQHELQLKALPMTNEAVGRYIYNHMREFHYSETKQYEGCAFELYRVVLNVMGVNDVNNHSDGFATYEFTNLEEGSC